MSTKPKAVKGLTKEQAYFDKSASSSSKIILDLSVTKYSAHAPLFILGLALAATFLLIHSLLKPDPTSVIVPEHSNPGMNGNGCFTP